MPGGVTVSLWACQAFPSTGALGPCGHGHMCQGDTVGSACTVKLSPTCQAPGQLPGEAPVWYWRRETARWQAEGTQEEGSGAGRLRPGQGSRHGRKGLHTACGWQGAALSSSQGQGSSAKHTFLGALLC